MARRIDYYFSLLSPWAYIGHRHFLEIARRSDAAIAYRPVLLNEVFSETGGLPLAKRHPARQAYRILELQRWREKRKLAFHLWPKHWPYDADLANCAALAIVAAGADPGEFVQKPSMACGRRRKTSPIPLFWRISCASRDSTRRPCSPAPIPERFAMLTSATGLTRLRPASSERPLMSSMARFSGARIASTFSPMR
jgi:hypothetical protein